MTIQLDLPMSVVEALQSEADARGLMLEDYIGEYLRGVLLDEQAVETDPLPTMEQPASITDDPDMAMLDEEDDQILGPRGQQSLG